MFEWMTVWGEHASYLEARAKKKPTPAWEARPVFEGSDWLSWRMFIDLHRSRSFGLAPNAITPSDILAYLEIHVIHRTSLRTYLYRVIVEADFNWLKAQSDDSSEQHPKSSG